MNNKSLLLALTSAALLGAASVSQAFTLNFDGPGSTADDFAPVNVTLGYGERVLATDEFGDEIAGSEHWQFLSGSDRIAPVTDPSTVGYGLAPSGSKALDARDGTILLVFTDVWDISAFSATLDNSTFGNAFDTPIEFYSENNTLLYSLSVDQSIPGLTVGFGGLSLQGVKTIVLPSTAFYDDVQVVPEPSTWVMFGCGVAFLLYRLRRRLA